MDDQPPHAPEPSRFDAEQVQRAGPVVRAAGWLCTWTGAGQLATSVAWMTHGLLTRELYAGPEQEWHLQLVWFGVHSAIATLLIFAGWRLRIAGRDEDARMVPSLTLGFVAIALHLIAPIAWNVYWWITLPAGTVTDLGFAGVADALLLLSLLVAGWWLLRRPPPEGAAGGRRLGWSIAACVTLAFVAGADLAAFGSMLMFYFGSPGMGPSLGGFGGVVSSCATMPGILVTAIAAGIVAAALRRGVPMGTGAAAFGVVAILIALLGSVVGAGEQFYWFISASNGWAENQWVVPYCVSQAAMLAAPAATVAVIVRAAREPAAPPLSAATSAAPPAAPATPPPA